MEALTIVIGFISYIIGAIPTGYLIARLKGISDIRKHGSGNIGATNVSRILGKPYFFLIFFLDAGKAFLFIQFLKTYFTLDYLCVYAGIFLLGNTYSIFLQGSGGKGVATLLGLLTALEYSCSIVIIAVWILLMGITKTVGISSVGAIAFFPLYTYYFDNNTLFLFSLFAVFIIIFKHRTNIISYFN